jgi:hypothetical protein
MRKRKKRKITNNINNKYDNKRKKRFLYINATNIDRFRFFTVFSFVIYTIVEDTRNELALLSDHTTNIKQEKKNKGKG